MSHSYSYWQWNKHFGLSYVRLGRRSLVKTAHSPVIMLISLHQKHCDIIVKNNMKMLSGIQLSFFPLGPCKCVYYTLLKVTGQCALRFWCLLCLGIWPSPSQMLAGCSKTSSHHSSSTATTMIPDLDSTDEPSCSHIKKPVPSVWLCSVYWQHKIFLLSALTLVPT
jgi:hypothetical protein